MVAVRTENAETQQPWDSSDHASQAAMQWPCARSAGPVATGAATRDQPCGHDGPVVPAKRQQQQHQQQQRRRAAKPWVSSHAARPQPPCRRAQQHPRRPGRACPREFHCRQHRHRTRQCRPRAGRGAKSRGTAGRRCVQEAPVSQRAAMSTSAGQVGRTLARCCAVLARHAPFAS